GPYRVRGLLALGAWNWIYEADDLKTGERFAIKALLHSLSADAAARRRLEREARIGAEIQHPNLVRTWSCSNAIDGTAFLVMDLVEGVTLADLVVLHGPLPWREACNYVFQASVGLARLHAAGIVHGDVRPAHLLIEHEGGLKIADFGQAAVSFADDVSPRQP